MLYHAVSWCPLALFGAPVVLGGGIKNRNHHNEGINTDGLATRSTTGYSTPLDTPSRFGSCCGIIPTQAYPAILLADHLLPDEFVSGAAPLLSGNVTRRGSSSALQWFLFGCIKFAYPHQSCT